MATSLDALVPDLRPFASALVDAANRAGFGVRVTSTRRNHAEQKRLYSDFLAGSSKYPVAPPGHSSHEYGWAFDCVPAVIETQPKLALKQLRAMARLWKSWGGAWGGSFRDPIHFELPHASAVAEALGRAGDAKGHSFLLSAADFLAGFTPLGVIQTAESISDLVAPLHCSPGSSRLDCKIQSLIQHPFTTLFGS